MSVGEVVKKSRPGLSSVAKIWRDIYFENVTGQQICLKQTQFYNTIKNYKRDLKTFYTGPKKFTSIFVHGKFFRGVSRGH